MISKLLIASYYVKHSNFRFISELMSVTKIAMYNKFLTTHINAVTVFHSERSGKLTVANLKALCKQFGVNLKDEEIMEMVSL